MKNVGCGALPPKFDCGEQVAEWHQALAHAHESTRARARGQNGDSWRVKVGNWTHQVNQPKLASLRFADGSRYVFIVT